MATILTDNFDSYNDGDLHAQGSWDGSTAFDIQGTVKQGGTKAVQCASADIVVVSKTGTQQTAGTQAVYMRRSVANDGSSRFYIKDGAADANQNAGILFYSNGVVYRMVSGANTQIGTYSADTWYLIDIEWRSSPSHQIRFRFENGAWSDWESPINDWTTGPDRVQLYVRDQTTATSYWDTIAEAVTTVAPTVTTQAASAVEKTTCTGNGNITATGGADCSRRGFCYKAGTSGDPTTADSVAYDDGTFGTGAYIKGITGLTKGTGYRIRAYAVNSAGTSYGATVQITTKTDAVIQKSLKYSVIKEISAIEKGLIYKVKTTPSAITKSERYAIKSAVKKTKGLEYQILTTPSAQEKSLTYAIKAPAGPVTKSDKYTIKATATPKTKSLNYQVKYPVTAITKGLIYDWVRWFQPSELQIVVGSIISGILSDTYHNGGVTLDLAETSGNPGFVYDFIFKNVASDNYTAHFTSAYDGSVGHKIILEQWNFNTSEYDAVTGQLKDFDDDPVLKDYNFNLLDPATHISGGEIRLRLNHTSPGTATHKFIIDQLILQYVETLQRNIIYKVKAPTAKTKNIVYTVKASATPVQESLQYAIRQTKQTSKGLIYDIRSIPSAITKTLKYAIPTTPSAITKELIYKIATTIPEKITKLLHYAIVKEQTAITKQIVYKVKPKKKKTKSLTYMLAGQGIIITKSIEYTIRIYPYKKQILNPYKKQILNPYKKQILNPYKKL